MTFGVVQYPLSIIYDTCGFRIDRKLRPGLIRDAELGFCGPVEDSNGLNQIVVFDGSSHPRIRTKTIYPRANIQERARIRCQDTEVDIRIRSGLSARV